MNQKPSQFRLAGADPRRRLADLRPGRLELECNISHGQIRGRIALRCRRQVERTAIVQPTSIGPLTIDALQLPFGNRHTALGIFAPRAVIGEHIGMMAAATVNIPAIVLSGGPMLNGWHHGQRAGSGTVVWKAARAARGRRDRLRTIPGDRGVLGALARPLQHDGHSLDHELARRGARHVAAGLRGDSRALSRARPDLLTRQASGSSRWSGRILKPSDILTRKAFGETHR